MRNPDVTVRSRGVMEKCTYCVQRINAARINAEIENRPVARRRGCDGLPGGLPDQGDRVRQLERPRIVRSPRPRPARATTLCSAELNTRPRTTYLAKLAIPTPRSRQARAMTPTDPESAYTRATAPILGPEHTYASVTDKISAIVLVRPYNWRWFLGMAIGFVLTLVLLVSIVVLF